jgi:hypothetical protein
MKKWMWLLISASVLSAAGSESKGEKEVLAAMDSWKQATMKKDKAALEKLLHEVIKSVTTGPSTVEAITFTNNTVRVYGNTALVKGKVDITNKTDGKATTANLDILHVWLKGSQGWQLVARQAVRLTQ